MQSSEQYSHDQAEKDIRIKVLSEELIRAQEEKIQAHLDQDFEKENVLETKSVELLAEIKSIDPEVDTGDYSLDQAIGFLVHKYNLNLHKPKYKNS